MQCWHRSTAVPASLSNELRVRSDFSAFRPAKHSICNVITVSPRLRLPQRPLLVSLLPDERKTTHDTATAPFPLQRNTMSHSMNTTGRIIPSKSSREAAETPYDAWVRFRTDGGAGWKRLSDDERASHLVDQVHQEAPLISQYLDSVKSNKEATSDLAGQAREHIANLKGRTHVKLRPTASKSVQTDQPILSFVKSVAIDTEPIEATARPTTSKSVQTEPAPRPVLGHAKSVPVQTEPVDAVAPPKTSTGTQTCFLRGQS